MVGSVGMLAFVLLDGVAADPRDLPRVLLSGYSAVLPQIVLVAALAPGPAILGIAACHAVAFLVLLIGLPRSLDTAPLRFEDGTIAPTAPVADPRVPTGLGMVPLALLGYTGSVRGDGGGPVRVHVHRWRRSSLALMPVSMAPAGPG